MQQLCDLTKFITNCTMYNSLWVVFKVTTLLILKSKVKLQSCQQIIQKLYHKTVLSTTCHGWCSKSQHQQWQELKGQVDIIPSTYYHTIVCAVVIAWWLDLQLSVSITTNVLRLNPVHGKVYLIPNYVIKLVSYLRQVGIFLYILRFPPPITLTATIQLKYC